MDKWRKKIIVIFILVCMVSLVGCVRTKIVDKLSIVHVFGFDLSENGKLKGSALIPEYTKSKGSDKIHYLQESADAVALLSPKMATRTSTPIELAKIRVLLFGKEFAEAGIHDVVERLLVTPQIATNTQIAVSTHTADETLTALKKRGDLSLAEQLRQNMTGQLLPMMNLHFFLNHYYGEGLDPYIPMVTIDKNKEIQVDKIAIFKDDKFKLHLNAKETYIFTILKDYRTQATYEIFPDEEKRNDAILIRGFRNKIKWDWVKNEQQLNLSLNLLWTITQRPTRYDLENPTDIEALRKLIKKEVKKDIEELIHLLQETGVDPLGIGNIVRSQDRDWDEASFYEQYPSLPINIDIQLEIIHSGLQG